MDQETRNKLQRATQQIRRLLEAEFAEQLEGTFDILPSGKVLPTPGKHLDARQRLTRQKLVDAIEHIKAGGKKPKEAVEEYTREAAFTFLNRFVALRMLEARDLLQECVSKGDQSSGFREFFGLAPGLASLPDGGYQLYFECLFDELSVEVKVLFDRRDSASLLWPRRTALNELLDILGQTDLAGIWSEDETIGWVYQYFNSGEERRKMREESQAPRNSRELAVRNQFFTPRYVVEFLTDNTLGRIWYEMRKGETLLVKQLRYLVRRPSEVFLNECQEPPNDNSDAEHEFSQEELLKKTVYIPHRAKKDPRDLKILDPACGSGHFLLYAYELLISIYVEAWCDEAGPKSEVTGRSLRDDYTELELLHAALPSLVLAHNLYGIDIDPRAAQIAALALWMRGQRAFNEFQIAREERAAVARSNIVCAEPMPGEAAFLEEFIAKHLSEDAEGRFLASLVRKVFEVMKLAGEAGSLLKIEEEIADEVAKAKAQWLGRPDSKQQTLFDDGSHTVQTELDLTRGITDESFWEEAEQRIYDALRAYSEQAERSGGFQRRLFAIDAARGFGLIDLSRHRFDVALMNPPFGQSTAMTRKYLNELELVGREDIGSAMVAKSAQWLTHDGRMGAITNRTYLAIQASEAWRRAYLFGESRLSVLADLGYGVLDDAMVEAGCYVITRTSESSAVFFGMLEDRDKESRLLDSVNAVSELSNQSCIDADRLPKVHDLGTFSEFACGVIAHWLPANVLQRASQEARLRDTVGRSRAGFDTGDNFRFLRLAWEVAHNSIGAGDKEWALCSKGGEYAPFYEEPHLLVRWGALKREMPLLPGARIFSTEFCFRSGVVYPMRTTSDLSPRPLPSNCAFTKGAQFIGDGDTVADSAFVALAYTRPFKALVEATYGGGDVSVAGSAARNYTIGVLESIPVPKSSVKQREQLASCFRRASVEVMKRRSRFETSLWFCGPADKFDAPLETLAARKIAEDNEFTLRIGAASLTADEVACDIYGFADNSDLDSIWGPHPFAYVARRKENFDRKSAEELLGRLAQGRWSGDDGDLSDEFIGSQRVLTKKGFFANRVVEVIAHLFGIHPESVCELLSESRSWSNGVLTALSEDIVSYAFGCAIQRWSSKSTTSDNIENPFGPVPLWPRITISAGEATTSLIHVDPGGRFDVGQELSVVLERISGRGKELSDELATVLLPQPGKALECWINEKFFDFHIQKYSRSRRKAPIYWQLATPSASYSVWLYFHRFTRDTFFQLLNEYVKPKLNHEQQKLERMRGEVGAEPTRSQRKEIEDQEKFVSELAAMVEEAERIAPLWNPNLNDGVIINFAPLWRLVPQNKAWQKECKSCWDTLVKGEYEWAHLAMHLWPERVVPKCLTNASLAIAHGLADVFWQQDDRDRFQPKDEPEGGWEPVIDRLVKERTSPAVKAALQSLLDAPTPSAGSQRSRGRARARA